MIRKVTVLAGVLAGLHAMPAHAEEAVARDKPADKTPDLRVGPIVGLAVPGGLEGGVVVIHKRFLGFGGAIGTIPTMRVPGLAHNARLTRFSAEVDARIYPLKGAFFVGSAFGYAHTAASIDDKLSLYGVSAPMTVRAEMSTFYAKPEIGFLWKWSSGLMVGADAGVLIPVVGSTPSLVASAGGETQGLATKGQAADALRSGAKTPLPALALLRVGWLL